jgi:hypothetical protein
MVKLSKNMDRVLTEFMVRDWLCGTVSSYADLKAYCGNTDEEYRLFTEKHQNSKY